MTRRMLLSVVLVLGCAAGDVGGDDDPVPDHPMRDHGDHPGDDPVADRPHEMDPLHDVVDELFADPTDTAVRSGAWSDPSTWESGVVPGERSRVAIPADLAVTVDAEISAAHDWVRVDGTLRFATEVTTALVVETMFVTGRFEMGTAEMPIAADVTATLTFRSLGSPIDHAVDPLEITRGLIATSPISIHGAAKTEILALADLPGAGATMLELERAPVDWRVGDELLIAPTFYGQDEVVTVTSIDGATVGISPALEFTRTNVPPQPRIGPPVEYRVHVGNLTRNAIVRTDPAQAATVRFRTELQGHVMLMGGGHDVFDAAFVDTGRTTVQAMTDPAVLPDGTRDPQLMPLCGVTEENVRGRYSLHFHRPGPLSAPSHVEGVVIRVRRNMGLKVGVQNHSAHIVGRRIVSHQIDGSHLFTEEGDELGEYTDSLAVHSFGSNASKDILPGGSCPQRNYSDIHHARRRDMGHMGAGVWLQGNLVRLDGSVFAGHDHAGVDHSAQGLDLNLDNTFAVRVAPSMLPEGLWWLNESGFRDGDFDPNEPLLAVGIPVWILEDVQIYAIGHQKNARKAAIQPKFTTHIPRWNPRPKNIFRNILAWNVWACINTEYSPWGILENVTCVAGDARNWPDMPNYERTGVQTRRQARTGWWLYRNVRIDGFTDHRDDSGLNRASDSREFKPSDASRYEGVYVNGIPYVPEYEACDDGTDNDADGMIDEDCIPEPPHPLMGP